MPWSETPYSNYDLVGGELEPEVLFEDKTVTDTVKNTIGDITIGDSVSTLRTTYATLDDLVAGMLQISTATSVTPTPINDSFLFLENNQDDRDVKITSSFPGTITVTFNRGKWNDGFFADGITETDLVAYNPTLATFTGAFGITNETINFTPASINNTLPKTVDYSRGLITGTFSNWTTYTLTGTMTSGNQPPITVYSNFPYQTETSGTIKSYSASFIRNVYKPFFVNSIEKVISYRGTPDTLGYSGIYSTNKIFSNTNLVYVPRHPYNHTIAIPFNPQNGVYEYDRLFNLWTSVNYTALEINNTTAPYLPSSETATNSTYYLITLDPNVVRVNVDVRLNK